MVDMAGGMGSAHEPGPKVMASDLLHLLDDFVD
jgi:hypothetical protein